MDPEADARTRTADPFITSEVLYQLSYVGEGARGESALAPDGGKPLKSSLLGGTMTNLLLPISSP